MRFRLRTLLILMALLPPLMAWLHFKAERMRAANHLKQIGLGLHNYSGDALWLRLPDGRPAYMANVPIRPKADESDDE